VTLRAWAETNVDEVLAARALYDAQRRISASPEPEDRVAEG
jgi:hypothetical protein